MQRYYLLGVVDTFIFQLILSNPFEHKHLVKFGFIKFQISL